MLKETKKIVWLGALALLVLVIIAVFTLSPSNKEKKQEVNIPVDKDSEIVSCGEYIYFNSPEGDIMKMNAFETTPELLISGWKVMSVSEKNMVLRQNENSIAVFSVEELGIEEVYDVKTDTAYCTDGAVYYKNMDTNCIMQIDRETKEEIVFLNTPVNDFLIHENQLIAALEGKGKGMAMYDFAAGSATLYASEKTVTDISYSSNMIVYTVSGKSVRRLNLNNGNDIAVKNVETDSLCFCKGVYFYVEKAKGGYRLGINDEDAFI